MVKLTYDSEAKVLSIRFAKRKSVDSEIKDNVVLDYDEAGKLVNIDVMELSLEEFLKISSIREKNLI
jgi:uncharacterized protein YuzE